MRQSIWRAAVYRPSISLLRLGVPFGLIQTSEATHDQRELKGTEKIKAVNHLAGSPLPYAKIRPAPPTGVGVRHAEFRALRALAIPGRETLQGYGNPLHNR